MRRYTEAPGRVEEDYPPYAALRAATGLTPSQSKIALELAARGEATYRRIVHVLYADSVNGGPDDTTSIIKVHVHKMRRRLTPLGVTIRTDWGVGLRVEGRSLAKLRTLAGLSPAGRGQERDNQQTEKQI